MPWVGLADAPAWKFYRVHSFLDYIMGGCQIHFTVSARDPHCHPAPLPAPPHPAEPLHARRARAPSPPEQWAVCIPGCSKALLEGPPPPRPLGSSCADEMGTGGLPGEGLEPGLSLHKSSDRDM